MLRASRRMRGAHSACKRAAGHRRRSGSPLCVDRSTAYDVRVPGRRGVCWDGRQRRSPLTPDRPLQSGASDARCGDSSGGSSSKTAGEPRAASLGTGAQS